MSEFKRIRPVPWFWLAVAAVCFFWTFCAHAQVTTYAYQGAPWDAGGLALSGFIELSAPLAPSSTVTITPSVQSFLANADGILSLPTSFTLTTDANGTIVHWVFSGAMDWACVCTIEFTSSDTAFDSYISLKWGDPLAPPVKKIIFQSTQSGVWQTIAGPPTMAMQPQVAQAQAQTNGEIADVAYLNMIDNQVQTQRDANWNRLVYLNTLANQLQAQVALCRANAGKC